jgi:hypothetical protein
MNEDMREAFADAVAAFRKFADEQGRPTDLVRISQDRVLARQGSVWIFRPGELTDDDQRLNNPRLENRRKHFKFTKIFLSNTGRIQRF